MELFYTSTENVDLQAQRLVIDGDEFHHLVRVLRKKTGDCIFVTDGSGLCCEVTISDVGKTSLKGEIVAHTRLESPKTGVTVALSLLKAPQRFELFLEKATELGVSTIIPMITSRTISLVSSEKVQSKLNRWRTIVLSAARQSKRYYLPQLCEPLSFSKVLLLPGYDLKLIPYEGTEMPPAVECCGKQSIFLIGGEGGFTAGEVQEAQSAGFRAISLGRTILRAETAGIFAVAYVRSQLLKEDCVEWY
ncbi:MAG: 16S rRNA (uracil(1498)-N(3))-methyltransferase [Chlorobiaceae bacterium]